MSNATFALLYKALGETVYMIAVSGTFACIGGFLLGIVLCTTARGGLLQRTWLNNVIGIVVNATRSTPFIILMVALIPFTRMLAGSSIGTTAAIVPLSIAALPFMARIVESALKETDGGVVEAAQAMGATPFQIISKVMIPEAVPSLVRGITLMFVNLVGFSAMAGVLGGGGLGDLAIRFGHQRFRPDIMIATVLILIVMVQGFQSIGDMLERSISKKRGIK